MSEFIASAEIAIIPNTREFRSQLKRELTDATKTPVAIKLKVDATGFERQLRGAVRSVTQNVKAEVLVRADITGFERDLRTKVQAVAERVSANVKVTAGTARQATTGGGGGTPRTRRPTPVLSDTGKPLFGAAAAAKTEARAREKAELEVIKKIQAAEINAHAENIARDQARAAADERARLKVLADLEKQGLLSSTGRPLTGAARDARLEAQARIKANADALKQMQADEIAAHKEDLNRARRRIAAERAAQQELRRNALKGQAGVVEDPERLAARAQARKVLTSAQTAAITIDNAEIGAMNKLEAARAREAAAQRLATEATVARQTAERLGLRTTAAAIALEEELALARLASEQATLRSALGEESLAKRRSFFTRAIGAQSAAFAGLRGAVLAANPAFIAGTVAAIAFGKAIGSAAAFESQLNVFRVTAGATAEEMERVAVASQRLGRDVTLPGVGAADAAEAMTSLAKAGLSVEDSLAGARGVLQLATAAAITNAEATELAASAINAFGLAGEDAVHVADVFANSANLAQGSIQDVAIALQQASAVARQVGVSFEDTTALLTLLARNGIRGSDAGTSLRVAFTRLIAPTAQAAEVLRDLNVQVRDAQGNLRPEVFSDIAVAMQGMSRAQQDANAKIIFGVDALRAFSIISREGEGSLNATRNSLGEQGTAAELAAARMAGLTGAAENLKNQLSALGLAFGSLVTGPMAEFTNAVSGMVGTLSLALGGIGDLVKGASGLVDQFKDLTSVEIGGFTVGPAQGILAPLEGVKDANAFIQSQFQKSIRDARVEVIAMVGEFNKVGGGTQLNTTVKNLKNLQAELQGGNKESQDFAKSIGALIKQIQDDSADADVDLGEMKLEIPPELLSGEPGRLAAKASKKAFQDEMKKPFEVELDPEFNLAARFKQQGIDAFADAAAAWRREVAKGMAAIGQEIRDSTGRLNVLAGEALQIEIAGGPNELQRLLRNTRAAVPELQRQVDLRRQQLKPGQQSSPALRDALQAMKDNKDKQDSIIAEIQGIAQKAQDDADKAKKEIQDKLDKADQALLDSFAPAERRVERRQTIAAQTPGVQDDIAAAKARKRQLLTQIKVIGQRFNDTKAAAQLIFERRQEILDIEEKIANDTKTARDQITETLNKRIELAQLQGGKGAILKAIDRAIADAKNRVKNWKKLGLVLLDEQIALARLVKSRKDFLKDLTGNESPDVFVDRIFREAVDQFRRFGSNISVAGQGSGIISPQGARGAFASILTGGGQNIPNLNESTAQRTREASLAEERKQTGYLQIIAGGQRTRFVKGTPLPPEETKVSRDVADKVQKGL